MKGSALRISLVAIAAASLAACGKHTDNRIEQGQVQLTITTVPADVQCIQLTASGSSTAVRSFDVIPQQSANVSATGLPTGYVTLAETAYNLPCALVSAETPPTWMSQPVYVLLQPGQVAAINIELVRPGSVAITNSFNDNPLVDGGTDGPVVVRDGGLDRPIMPRDGNLDQPIMPRDGSLDQPIMPRDGSLDRPIMPRDGSLDQPIMPRDGSLDQPIMPRDGSLDQPIMPRDGSLDRPAIVVDSALRTDLPALPRDGSVRTDLAITSPL